MRISDWSSDVCSSDLGDGEKDIELAPCGGEAGQRHDELGGDRREEVLGEHQRGDAEIAAALHQLRDPVDHHSPLRWPGKRGALPAGSRSEEHTSELQSLMRISYAVFCLKKKKIQTIITCTRQN